MTIARESAVMGYTRKTVPAVACSALIGLASLMAGGTASAAVSEAATASVQTGKPKPPVPVDPENAASYASAYAESYAEAEAYAESYASAFAEAYSGAYAESYAESASYGEAAAYAESYASAYSESYAEATSTPQEWTE
ncbi:hypothetical protein ACWGNF_24570 [Streptomyces sp. NPDC055808]